MSSNIENGCGCGHGHEETSSSCGCGSHDHSHDHGSGCGCGSSHGQSVTLTLNDGSELVCPVLDIFEIEEQSYIALLNPDDDTALLYRFFEKEDNVISIENIDSDEEFDFVSKTFLAMQEDE